MGRERVILRLGALASIAVIVAGCSDSPRAAGSASASSSAAALAPGTQAPPQVASSAPPMATGSTSSTADSLEILKFQFTSAVKAREPVDKLVHATRGQKVYAYFTIRNRTGLEQKVHLSFKVNGKQRSEVDLDVQPSWSFRTWGYNTILKNDKPGKLELTATDEANNVLTQASLPFD